MRERGLTMSPAMAAPTVGDRAAKSTRPRLNKRPRGVSETRFAMPRLALPALLALALGVSAVPAAEPEKGSPLSLLRAIDEGFTQLFEKIAPSVVVIEAVKKTDA